jgi:hypothetical protein
LNKLSVSLLLDNFSGDQELYEFLVIWIAGQIWRIGPELPKSEQLFVVFWCYLFIIKIVDFGVIDNWSRKSDLLFYLIWSRI